MAEKFLETAMLTAYLSGLAVDSAFFISGSIFATAREDVIFLEANGRAPLSTLVRRRCNGALLVVWKRKKHAQGNGVPSLHEVKGSRL